MYNYFTCQRNEAEIKRIQQMKDKQRVLILHRKMKTQQLVNDYVERARKTIHFEGNKQNYEVKYRDQSYNPRPENKKMNIGSPGFYYRDRTERERINAVMKKNLNLDQVPFNSKQSPTQHKFRQTGKGISMKFTPFNENDRIFDNINRMRTNQIPKSYHEGEMSRISQKSGRVQKQYLINLFPTLNVKRHPKSYESMKNKLKIGPIKHIKTKRSKQMSETTRKQRQLSGSFPRRVKFETHHAKNPKNT